ncbi:MAG TPA: WbuC family cupin fold metalloprotein [Polyangiaceae bacterium]|jgi:cupin fold WbuC family metalloprotein|nr:WbuC family cupin fold metalloprotein [Polyangiaceae bacterium]
MSSEPAVAFTRIDSALIESTIQRAKASPRKRAVHCFHTSDAANLHRFLNVFTRGTYCTPHRHLDPPKAEGLVVLRGELGIVIFDELGKHLETVYLTQANPGIDLPPGVWHTVVAVSDVAVCYETKPGPYDPATDKEFAAWAPREGADGVLAYLAKLEALCGLGPVR